MTCTWTSTKFNRRTPGEHVLLRTFVGGPRHQEPVDLPDEELVQLVREELRQIMGVAALPAVTRIYRWPGGNPQYDVGHLERVDQLEAMATDPPGLFLTGSAYRGVGLPDCIQQGQATAEAVLEAIAKERTIAQSVEA